MSSLILGSTSARRAEYLQLLGVSFRIDCPEYDETTTAASDHALQAILDLKLTQLRQHLAQAQSVPSDQILLVADTLVVLDDQVLGKPLDQADAEQMISRLSGRCHQVHTGVRVGTMTQFSQAMVMSKVQFCTLTDKQIQAYVATGESMGKAGAYGLQGIGGALVQSLQGSVSGVIGLPLAETYELLCQWQVPSVLNSA